MKRISRRRFLKTAGLSGAGLVGSSGYGFAVEPILRLEVTRYRVNPPHWPRDLKLSIGVIADIHAGGPSMPAERIRAIAAQANALKPDLIVLLGDYAGRMRFKTHTVPPQEWAEALGALNAPLGVHAILGNHDWWDDLAAQRARKGPVIGRAHWNVRASRFMRTTLCAWRLMASLSGSPAWAISSRSSVDSERAVGVHSKVCDDLDGTLAKVTDAAPVILLAHEPDIFPLVPPRVSAHPFGAHARRTGAYARLFAHGALTLTATVTHTAT